MTRLLLMVLLASVPWHASEIGRSPHTAWSTPQTLVFADPAAFRGAWAQLYPNASLRPALPAIDFARYRVVVVALGNRPSGGYRLALDAGRATADSALLNVTAFTPPPGCGVTQEITTPAVAIAVPNTPVPFRIMTRTRPDTVRCN